MPEDIRTPIRQFIIAKFPQITLQDDQDIFTLGFINSLFALELVMFVEKTYGVRLPNQDLKTDNFRTVNAMAELVQRVTSGAEISAG